MTKQQMTEMLILLGAVSFAVGVFLKIAGQDVLFEPLVYWRFSIGCLALAIAVLLQRIADKK